MKYTIADFNAEYPDDDACLHDLFLKKFGNLAACPSCGKSAKFHKVYGRKCYACQWCAAQLHPLADTIFHKSSTPLRSWFYAIYLFSNAKNGVSAKELERQLGVTYKCAWRMAAQIRELFAQVDNDQLSGTVEADETYVGGKRRGKRGRGAEGKVPVFGMLQRDHEVRARVTVDTKRVTVAPILRENVQIGATIYTDEYSVYNKLSDDGYDHQRVNHSAKDWVAGQAHTNTIEGFWSQLKRSIDGTYHSISGKYLQRYVNEFCWRYNNRKSVTPLFSSLVSRIVPQSL